MSRRGWNQISKHVSIMSREQMEKLTTKRLLAYKKRLMNTHETPDGHDICLPSCVGDCGWAKSHPNWKAVYANLKTVLETREHVEKK